MLPHSGRAIAGRVMVRLADSDKQSDPFGNLSDSVGSRETSVEPILGAFP